MRQHEHADQRLAVQPPPPKLYTPEWRNLLPALLLCARLLLMNLDPQLRSLPAER